MFPRPLQLSSLNPFIRRPSIHKHASRIRFSTMKAPQWTQPFRILDGSTKKDSATFKENESNMHRLLDDLNGTLDKIRIGGPQKAVDKHIKKGKLVARDRISRLLDIGSPFMELSPLAGHELYTELNEKTGTFPREYQSDSINISIHSVLEHRCEFIRERRDHFSPRRRDRHWNRKVFCCFYSFGVSKYYNHLILSLLTGSTARTA